LTCLLPIWRRIPSGTRQLVLILSAGIFLQLGAFSILGALGYSKLLRYVSQTVPLAIAISLIPLKLEIHREPSQAGYRPLSYWCLPIYAALLFRELLMGVKVLLFVPGSALIEPFIF
jgi:hypothetical protein